MIASDITVTFATDSKFKYYTGVAIFSLLKHTSSTRKYNIIILEENLTDEDKALFYDMTEHHSEVSLEFINMAAIIQAIGREKFYTGDYSHANYYRLFLTDILSDCDKVIYLDSDIIIQDDIAKLWDIDIQSKPIAGIKDWPLSDKYRNEFLGKQMERYILKCLHLRTISGYINSGVLLMNLRRFKEMNFKELAINEINTGFKFKLVDQDILNRIFEEHIFYLDTTWNCSPIYFPQKIEFSSIVHFAAMTPWISRAIPYSSLWWKYADESPFSNILDSQTTNGVDRLVIKLQSIEKSMIWRITAPYRLLRYLLSAD